MEVVVIVPTLNSERTIERCLASLSTLQTGRFRLRVHVQDGQSTDRTLEIVDRWKNRGVTYAEQRDGGIYDAINRAAAACLGDADLMSWLGSDDLLLPGALATITSIFTQRPEVEWLTGHHYVANAAGECFSQEHQFTFAHKDIAEGLHDGRTHEFILQEGTFWRTRLWRQAGGLDGTFRFAGDWDLWRRFAAITPLYQVHLPLGCFSRREGQLSENMDAYYKEVDAVNVVASSAARKSYDLRRKPWDEEWHLSHDIDEAAGSEPNAVWFRELLKKRPNR